MYDLEGDYAKAQFDTYKNYVLSTLDASISETNSLAASDAYFARIAADNYGTINVDDDAYAMRQQFDNDNFQARNAERKEINAAKADAVNAVKKETRNAVNNDFTGYFESLIGIQTTYENAIAAADETYYGTVTTADALFDTTVKTADKTYSDDYCRLTGQYYDTIIIIDGGGDIEDGAFENTNYVSLNFGQNNATQNNNNNTSNSWKQKLKEFGCSTLQFGIYFAEELGPSYSRNLDNIQTTFDVVGMVPVVGEPVDAVNGIIYAARGDYANAGFSAAAVVPVVGNASTGTKMAIKGANAVDTAKAAKHGEKVGDVVQVLRRTQPLTPQEMKTLVETNGWRRTKEISHGEAVYYDPNNKIYITKDNTIHNGGAIKVAKSVEELKNKETRMGTYDINYDINTKTFELIRIGD